MTGKNTVTTAIVKTPKGNSIIRLDTYKKETAVSSKVLANNRLTKILICNTAAPNRLGKNKDRKD